jgi:acid phosphatase class B
MLMRRLFLAVVSAAAFGLLIAPSAIAAPANGPAIQSGANAATLIEDVRVCRVRRWCNRRGCFVRRRCW